MLSSDLFLSLCQFILTMMVASSDGLQVIFAEASKLSLLNVTFRAHLRCSVVRVSFLHVLCFC